MLSRSSHNYSAPIRSHDSDDVHNFTLCRRIPDPRLGVLVYYRFDKHTISEAVCIIYCLSLYCILEAPSRLVGCSSARGPRIWVSLNIDTDDAMGNDNDLQRREVLLYRVTISR
jgi:hypothetical protein